jgi:hypothetical protein
MQSLISPQDNGTADLHEIIDEIEASCTKDGGPYDLFAMKSAAKHGLGYLTGSADALLSFAVGNEPITRAAVWEERVLLAAKLLILAVIERRRTDGLLAEQDLQDDNDGGGCASGDLFPEIAPHAVPPVHTFNYAD